MFRKKYLAILTSIATTLLFSVTTASANVVSNERLPFSFLFFNACTNEDVLVEGIFHTVVKEEIGEDGSISVNERINAHGSGLGLFSGAEYVWNDTFRFELDAVPEVIFSVRQTNFVRLVGKGNTPNELLRSEFVLRVDANGVIIENIENIACVPE